MLQLAADGKLEKVTLSERFVMAPPPSIELVNVGEAKRQNRMKQAFSAYMLEEIQNTLDAGAQVIVFQNRKGYVPYISCDFCGHTTHCVNCDISLTYYKSLNTQKCNYCGFTRDTEKQCPDCGSTSLSMRGFGTERIAEELEIYFPEARITRFDQVSIRKKSDFQRILNGFENKEIDILVGTQLLSKGLDFENVGLVCIPDADMLLNIPDFRSHERAFQQMHQVAGRSGRGTKQGKVIIQSYQPSHPVIQAVKNAAFEELAAFEIPLRKSLSYPPFTRLIRITLRHKDFVLCQNAADLYANAIRKYLMDRVVGPQSPGIGRIRGYYLQQLLVKMNVGKDDITRIKKYLSDAALHVQKTNDFKGLWFDFDVDPV
jgi:primosomal protein N' (replication factor Y) (superfamily II helicase)